jgi:hypothetical protein
MSFGSANLLANAGGYEGILSAEDVNNIMRGSTLEDGFLGERGIYHFYNPYTGLGLNFLGQQPSAIATAISVTRRDANPDSLTKWARALERFSNYSTTHD